LTLELQKKRSRKIKMTFSANGIVFRNAFAPLSKESRTSEKNALHVPTHGPILSKICAKHFRQLINAAVLFFFAVCVSKVILSREP
jgi:hypothetical protein